LRLAKAVNRPPSFEFYDYGMRHLACHVWTYHDDSASHSQLIVTQIWTKIFLKSVSFIG
jgi:hypothetical protein